MVSPVELLRNFLRQFWELRTENQVSTKAEHHLQGSMPLESRPRYAAETTHGVSPTERIAQFCTDENPWESDRSQEKLPLGRPLDVVILDYTGNDGTRKDTVGESNLAGIVSRRCPMWYVQGMRTDKIIK